MGTLIAGEEIRPLRSASIRDQRHGHFGMGELHLDIIVDRIKREFKVEVDSGAPEVSYRETCTKVVEHEERFRKQTGSMVEYAHIIFKLEPRSLARATIRGGSQGWQHPQGIHPRHREGIGRSLVCRSKVGLPRRGPEGHVARRFLPRRRFLRNGFPYLRLNGLQGCIPQCGAAAARTRDETLNHHAPGIRGCDHRQPEFKARTCLGAGHRVGEGASGQGALPARKPFRIHLELRNMTQGRAGFNMQFEFYEPVPQNIAEEVIAKRKKMHEEGK